MFEWGHLNAAQTAQCSVQRWWCLRGRRQWFPEHLGTLTSAASALETIRKPVSTLVLLYVSAVDHVSSVVWLNQRWFCFGCGVFVGCSLVHHNKTTQNHLLILWVKHSEIRAWENLHPKDLLPQTASAVSLEGRNSVGSGWTEGSAVKSGVGKQNPFCKIGGKKKAQAVNNNKIRLLVMLVVVTFGNANVGGLFGCICGRNKFTVQKITVIWLVNCFLKLRKSSTSSGEILLN